MCICFFLNLSQAFALAAKHQFGRLVVEDTVRSVLVELLPTNSKSCSSVFLTMWEEPNNTDTAGSMKIDKTITEGGKHLSTWLAYMEYFLRTEGYFHIEEVNYC